MPTLRRSEVLDHHLELEADEVREVRLGQRLRAIVAHAYDHAPRVRRMLDAAGLAPGDVRGLEDLEKLPVLRKDALPALQAEEPPFGGLLGVPRERLARVFMSPGPIFDPQGEAGDFWRFRHALAAAGFRRGEVVHNSASYHLTPLGFMLDAAARSHGCVVVPAGVGQTELQIKVAHHLGATAYLGTPSFLHALVSRARELGTPLRLEAAFVVAEMLPESLRGELETDFGIRVLQGYGTADLGCVAYECTAKDGWHTHPECIVEVLDLETGRAAAPGQAGEVVVTLFDEAYPLLRLATGDISAFAPDLPCGCSRSARRLTGLLGRIGDAVKVKGMFVRGAEIAAVMQRFPEVKRFQAVVTREKHQDQLAYDVELASPADGDATLAERLESALREAVKVRGEVRFVPQGTIAENAKRLDDRRVWK